MSNFRRANSYLTLVRAKKEQRMKESRQLETKESEVEKNLDETVCSKRILTTQALPAHRFPILLFYAPNQSGGTKR